jgi:hypothetical protein
MPHYKCGACKVRMQVRGNPHELVGDLCPDCGSLLQPVGDLTELVGFRSIKSVDVAGDAATPGAHQGIADLIKAVAVRRAALLAQDSVEAEGWLDDGGGHAEAVAVPLPVRYI